MSDDSKLSHMLTADPLPGAVPLAGTPETLYLDDADEVTAQTLPPGRDTAPAAFVSEPVLRPLHRTIQHMATMARADGIYDFALLFDRPIFAKLVAELSPDEREAAAHRWGGSELRVMTCNGFTRVVAVDRFTRIVDGDRV